VKIADWNRELSPWEAPPVFGKEGFGGGAEETLAEILPLCGEEGKRCFLGGYSLAGLFALWAVCRTERFEGAAAASPSVWFPGFTDYVKAHGIRCSRVYLSLGDREEKTRNPVMAAVGERIRELYAWLAAYGTDCVLEWNPGNHFREPELRTARAFAWLLGR
jgi:predicted alpha/beta superfamily hydrolase